MEDGISNSDLQRNQWIQKRQFFWIPRAIFTLVLLYVLGQAAFELYHSLPFLEILIKNEVNWKIVFLGLAALGTLLFLGAMAAVWFPNIFADIQQKIIVFRGRLDWLRWPIVLLISATLLYLHLYSPFGAALTGPFTRLILITITALLFAVLTTQDDTLIQRMNVFFGFLLVGGLFYFGQHFSRVTNFPFSLSWSEGNRLYDYSLYLGKGRYISTGDIEIVWGAHGRNLLWGIIFAVPNSPIWLHRLWNAILWTVPNLLLGYALVRWGNITRYARWVFILWVTLFLAQGPIYAPLVLSALLVVLLVRPNNLLLSIIGVGIAGYYAASSRWTWLPAPAVWAALILLSNFDARRNETWSKFILRLVPTGSVAFVGLACGMLANPTFFSPKSLTNTVAFSQPLLWYRLLPNSTYAEGIILGLVIAIGPLTTLMIWLFASKRWPLNWLQLLAFAGAPLAFLAIGLVASVKIGGGSNLHNLDMLLVTLAILSGLMLSGVNDIETALWSNFAQISLILTVLVPVWYSVKGVTPLELPPPDTTSRALRSINNLARNNIDNGEVLLMDQRQLLTFGYLSGIPLTTDYEKKYIMNQAMSDNSEYFKEFYTDLANKRFSIIITETLFKRKRGQGDTFGDENDAWVKWVSEPLLCYYTPIKRFREINVQILMPREEPMDCPAIAILD